MEKKQILGAIVVFILTFCVLVFNYKRDFKSVVSDNSSKNNSIDDINYDDSYDGQSNSGSGSINDAITKRLLDNINGKMCCEEIGGTVSGKSCVFEDLDGTELEINYRYLEDYNGKNYCTDEYFDRK